MRAWQRKATGPAITSRWILSPGISALATDNAVVPLVTFIHRRQRLASYIPVLHTAAGPGSEVATLIPIVTDETADVNSYRKLTEYLDKTPKP